MYKILHKIIDNNRIIGVVALNTLTNASVNIQRDRLAYYSFCNAKITSDNRIISSEKIDYIDVKKLKSDNKSIILYHGSYNKNVIPVFGRGSSIHDYGKGFYLTENKELAKEWSSCLDSTTTSYVYTFKLDLMDLKIFNFNDENELIWLAELMSHRDADNSARYKKFAPIFIKKFKKNINNYDVIYGWRADSSFFSIAKRFVRDEIDYNLISELFHLGGLENQVCIKSKKAFNQLSKFDVEKVDTIKYRNLYNKRDEKARNNMDLLISSDSNTMTKGFTYVLKELKL
jgi:hypothetical protein